jgi:hypothetical protein
MELLMKKFCLLFLPLILTGCTSLAEKAGRVLDGSAGAEKTLESYADNTAGNGAATLRRVRYRDGTEGIVITLEAWPTAQFRFIQGENSAGTQRHPLQPVNCTFLCSGYSGWNEITLELSGTGTLRTEENAVVTTLESCETLGILEGRIRQGDTRLSGQEARLLLQNRQERIDALTEWMQDYAARNAGARSAGDGGFSNQKEFEQYWKPLLFPELVSARKRPAAYNTENVQWSRGEDLRWNTAYTAAIFPELLRPLRDSGALLRDWEEALLWIYFRYQWDEIAKDLSMERTFVRNLRNR